jgi:hypothetical protein
MIKDAVRGFKLRKLEEGLFDAEVEEYRADFVRENLAKVKEALETYNRQMTVLFCTYLESITSEFVHDLFSLMSEDQKQQLVGMDYCKRLMQYRLGWLSNSLKLTQIMAS